MFECEDTGPGIALDNYQYLFRPFRENVEMTECIRVGKSGKVESGACSSEMSNVGLGLYSVANQISSIGGEYGFRPRETSESPGADGSKPSGCIFWFCIPLIVPESSASKVEKHPAQRKKGSTTFTTSIPTSITFTSEHPPPEVAVFSKAVIGIDSVKFTGFVNTALSEEDERKGSTLTKDGVRVRRSLVIDDSLVIRKSIGRALIRLGFDVDYAVNGLEGLRMLQQHVYDVVLCDYLMPVMDGLDCVQQYRDWEGVHRPWFRQYIVGISAHASSSDVEKGMKAGMNEFQGKPLTMKHLEELEKSDKMVQVKKLLDAELTVEFARPDGVELFEQTRTEGSAENGPLCLIAEPAGNAVMKEIIEKLGWYTVCVNDGEDALRLMKMRNWDAVMIENEISRLNGIGCVARFREWESENRIARQNNIIYLSTDFVPSPTESVSAVYPSGFDGALGKPVLVKDVKGMLESALSSDEAHSSSILAR